MNLIYTALTVVVTVILRFMGVLYEEVAFIESYRRFWNNDSWL